MSAADGELFALQRQQGEGAAGAGEGAQQGRNAGGPEQQVLDPAALAAIPVIHLQAQPQQAAARGPEAQAQRSAQLVDAAPGSGPAVPAMSEAVAQLVHVMQLDRQERISKEQQQEESARRAQAQHEEETLKAQVESAVRAIKDPTAKQACQFMLVQAGLSDARERTIMAKLWSDLAQQLEAEGDATDVEEANNILRQAVKKLKSMNAEKQEEVLSQLKVKKRKASSAAGSECKRCGRDGHEAVKCYAQSYADGRPMTASEVAGGAKRARQGPGPGTYGPGPAAYAPAYGQQMMYAPPVANQWQSFAPAAAAPAAMIAPQAPPPGPGGQQGGYAAFGQQQRPPVRCWGCGGPHRQNECPNPRVPAQYGPGPAGPGARQPPAGGQQVSGQAQAAASARQEAGSRHGKELMEVDRVDVHAVNQQQAPRARTPPVFNLPATEPPPQEEEEAEGSLASFYANTEVAWGRDEADEQPDSLSAYVTRISGHTVGNASSSSILDADVELEYRTLSAAGMAALAGEACGRLPQRMRSLRRAIVATFEGKKKLMGDAEVLSQQCGRCKKIGHTAGSCPDQVQRQDEDVTADHAWVRRLMNMPTVDIASENKGRSLKECIERWAEQGRRMNEGNPWEKSEKREDSLRKRLGYHKALGMSTVHLGWIGFGVPLKFVERNGVEIPPEPLMFRNHQTALEEAEFVDKEHAARVADGSYVVVGKDRLRGVCPLQVVKHPVSGKRRLVQDLRWINGHVPNVVFKMESLHRELGDVVKPQDKLMTTDIEKAYYCLAMHPDAQEYLGWEWKGKFYMPTCLVFGLSSAPRIFTKIMRPMMAFMRSAGVRVLGMIDDYLWAARPEEIEGVKDAVVKLLPGLGWSLNEKCELAPQDEVLMLGMLVNTARFMVRALS
jgi:hypothetical protein